jgi:hypothetical protein
MVHRTRPVAALEVVDRGALVVASNAERGRGARGGCRAILRRIAP